MPWTCSLGAGLDPPWFVARAKGPLASIPAQAAIFFAFMALFLINILATAFGVKVAP